MSLRSIARFEGEERRVLEAVFLYCVYHRFVEELDALIERQFKRRSGSVAFADDMLREYLRHLHRCFGTYEEVGRRAGIDRRTARKYLL